MVAAPKIEKEEHVLKTLVDDFEDTKIDCGIVAQKIDEYHTVKSLLPFDITNCNEYFILIPTKSVSSIDINLLMCGI